MKYFLLVPFVLILIVYVITVWHSWQFDEKIRKWEIEDKEIMEKWRRGK